MAYSYEVSVATGHRELFEVAMVRYLEDRGFAHMRVGGWPGTGTSHEFRRGDDLISLSILPDGQSLFRLIVDSESVPAEPLVLDVITEGMGEALQTFCGALSDVSSRQIVESLVKSLQDAFVPSLDREQ